MKDGLLRLHLGLACAQHVDWLTLQAYADCVETRDSQRLRLAVNGASEIGMVR